MARCCEVVRAHSDLAVDSVVEDLCVQRLPPGGHRLLGELGSCKKIRQSQRYHFPLLCLELLMLGTSSTAGHGPYWYYISS